MLALSIKMVADTLTIVCNILPFIWDNVHVFFPFISMQSQFQRAICYTLIEAFKSKAFQVPISAYQTFVIEKKYHFTNKTLQLFIYDLFVEAALMLITFPPIIYGYLLVVQMGGEYCYIFLSIFVILITIILSWIHPNLIAPLFNKFTQLQDQQLKIKIFNIASQNSIKLSNIYVINSSVRSAHSNAYLYGIGKIKVIVLFDSLLGTLTREQSLSVLCHEMGHSKYTHSLKRMVIYLIQVLSMFYIFTLFMKNENAFKYFGFTSKSIFVDTVLYFHMFQPLTSFFNVLLLVINRKFQFEADLFACQVGYGKHLKTSLIKLFKQSTAIVPPDALYAWIKYSHPSTSKRIQKIDDFLSKNKQKLTGIQNDRKKNKIIQNKNIINHISQQIHKSSTINSGSLNSKKDLDKQIQIYSQDSSSFYYQSSSSSYRSHYSRFSNNSYQSKIG